MIGKEIDGVGRFDHWPIDKLVPYGNNVKIHDDAQIAALAKRIEDEGFNQPILIDEDGVIIKGHGRRLAALKIGFKQVPVIVAEGWSESQKMVARIADNVVARTLFDEEGLKGEIDALAALEVDLSAIGFNEAELEKLMAGALSDFDFDDLELSDDDQKDKSSVSDAPKDKEPKVDKEIEYTTTFEVIVQCSGESDQKSVYDMLTEKGYSCKVLTL